MTTVAILQPTYWARAHVWNRVFHSDIFIWLDSVKFARSSTKWEDRTIVETPNGQQLVLRLPKQGSRDVPWSEARLSDGWLKHRTSILHCYARSAHWDVVKPMLDPVYQPDATTIEAVCWRSFCAISSLLQPSCKVIRSSDLDVSGAKGELMLNLVSAVGGSSYLTGQPGAAYLDQPAFAARGIAIETQSWAAPSTKHGLKNPSIIHLVAENGIDDTKDLLAG
ncbi:WbqC family protein [Nonomuraea sediminis]|uniref:WbqC family protein n=1 Tax=Nonomuraea sediminis TaxID=2835864 RepID=UPI001BDCBDE3|nr:WbqC family protein [Nonomuraea sediminis]